MPPVEPTGPLVRIARTAHSSIGLAAVILGLAHGIALVATRHGIKPFSALGWLPEQLLIGVAMLLPGLLVFVTACRRIARRAPATGVITAGALALAMLLLFGRYFDGRFAALALAALMDGVVLSLVALATTRHRALGILQLGFFTCALGGGVLFLGASYLGAGSEPAIVETVPWDNRRPPTIPSSAAGGGDPCAVAERMAGTFAASAADWDVLIAALRRAASSFSSEGLGPAYCRDLIGNLAVKQRARAAGADIPAHEVELRGIDFERFRLEAYLSSGVAPKRYFGFFDEQGDTAAHERALRRTLMEAVPMVNGYAQERRMAARITEMEVAVTFLAEGGALLLTEYAQTPDRIHPVRGIGLDNFDEGFARHAVLVARLDEHFCTRLGRLAWHIGHRVLILRPMTFREAILGTAIMYLDEKERTAARLPSQGPDALMAQPLSRQFVMASLVYNSGVSFSAERIDQLMNFATARYLAELEQQHHGRKRPLAVLPPEEARRRLQTGEALPLQLTSWSAVYHVLQRYGAWVALQRYSNIFDGGGRFR